MFRHSTFDPSRLQGKMILDIGCGRNKLPGAAGLDSTAHAGVDIVADLNRPLPVDSESYDVVHANQVLEHVQNLVGLMDEIWRVLKPGGMLVAHVPYFRSSWAHVDPTHVRSFTINTLDYFVQHTSYHERYRFSDRAFSSREIFLDSDYAANPLRTLFIKLALRWPARFENSVLSFLYPFEQLTFVLTK